MHDSSWVQATGLRQIEKQVIKKKKNETGVIVWSIDATHNQVRKILLKKLIVGSWQLTDGQIKDW